MSPIEVIRTYLRMYNDRTFETDAARLFQPNMAFVNATSQEAQDFGAFAGSWLDLLEVLPDSRATLLAYQINRDTVTVSIQIESTFTGEVKTHDEGTIDKTEQHIVWRSLAKLTFREGKIARWEAKTAVPEFMSEPGIG